MWSDCNQNECQWSAIEFGDDEDIQRRRSDALPLFRYDLDDEREGNIGDENEEEKKLQDMEEGKGNNEEDEEQWNDEDENADWTPAKITLLRI